MKKIKIFSAINSLILIPTISVSCANNTNYADKNNGDLKFNNKEDFGTWLASTEYVVSDPINVVSGNMTSLANFLNTYVHAVHITRAIATTLCTNFAIFLPYLKDTQFKYTTEDNKGITVSAYLNFADIEISVLAVHTFTKVNNSLFDKMTGTVNGETVQNNIVLNGKIKKAVESDFLELTYLNDQSEEVIVHLLSSDFPNINIQRE